MIFGPLEVVLGHYPARVKVDIRKHPVAVAVFR